MKKGYPGFDEYIRQGEPPQREAAYAWSTAIGLQAVDGLQTSDYLNDLARRNIEGEISIDEVSRLLDSYYKSKTVREADDDEKEEADKASKNIKKILSVKTFDFSTKGYTPLAAPLSPNTTCDKERKAPNLFANWSPCSPTKSSPLKSKTF